MLSFSEKILFIICVIGSLAYAYFDFKNVYQLIQRGSGRKPTWDEKTNPEGRFRAYSYDELVARDKCSLDLFWLKDESLEDSAKLPEPHILAEEIADDLRSALEQIESVLGDLQGRAAILAKRGAQT